MWHYHPAMQHLWTLPHAVQVHHAHQALHQTAQSTKASPLCRMPCWHRTT